MFRNHTVLGRSFLALLIAMLPMAAGAQIVFTWSEDASGVTMTTSGSIDTSELTSTSCAVWGGYGHESGTTDIIGDTELSAPDACFAFSAGTDFSAWQTSNPFSGDFFGYDSTSVTTPFYTYTLDSDNLPGLAVMASDLSGTTWTPSGGWVAAGQTLASMNLNAGTYTITDAATGASITFAIGVAAPAVPPQPVPALPLLGLLSLAGLLGVFGLRKLR